MNTTSPFRMGLVIVLFWVGLTAWPRSLEAQAPASPQKNELPVDSLGAGPELQTLKQINRGPKQALLWSIVPGGGQVYNKSWWKVPIVYGGLLGIVAVADFNQTQFSRFVTALEQRCLGDGLIVIVPNAECIPKDNEPSLTDFPTDALVRARNSANKNRQTAYAFVIAGYVLQAVEAFTDAHLRDFDISDDLSVRLEPTYSPDSGTGLGLVVPLGSGRKAALERARVRALSR